MVSNRNNIRKLLALIGLILLVIVQPFFAQTSNLLSNPGFESGFRIVQGTIPREVANSWVPWNAPRTSDMPGFQNIQPTYFAGTKASEQGAIPRIRSGVDSQVYFSYFATHDAGIYQRVSGLTSGTEVRFSIYGYILSTSLDNLNVSENPGGVALRVGIDPTGGTDPLASSVIYSEAAIFYDAFRQYSIIATTSSDAVTVFVRTTVSEPVQYTYIYLDDAVLEVTPELGSASTQAPTATNTVAPTNTTAPTNTVAPTNTTAPTNTVAPTSTTAPTNTTVPTNTVAPTNTTAPTNTVAPTSTTVAEEATPTREQAASQPTATQIVAITQQPTSTQQASSTPVVPISDEFPGRVTHRVQRGDTVLELAQLYGSSVNAIIQANGLDESALIYREQILIIPVSLVPATETPSPTPVAAQPATPVSNNQTGNRYVVQPGDTLSNIASRFNTTVGTLVQINGITNPNRIFVGQSITLPGSTTTAPASPQPTTQTQPTQVPANTPQTYVVQPGDNLYRISLRFGVTLADLASRNNITNYNFIFVGQVLAIP